MQSDINRKDRKLGPASLNFLRAVKRAAVRGLSLFNNWFCSVSLHMWVEIIKESCMNTVVLRLSCEGSQS